MKVTGPKKQPKYIQATEVSFGECFLYGPESRLLMRVKPVNYILNSSLVNDCINRNKVMVAAPDKGTCFFIEGDSEVIQVATTLVME